jgi:hypothetical protein
MEVMMEEKRADRKFSATAEEQAGEGEERR